MSKYVLAHNHSLIVLPLGGLHESGHSLFISMYLARESPVGGGFQEAVKDCLNLIVISGSLVDNSSAIAICASMGDSVVPGTQTQLK